MKALFLRTSSRPIPRVMRIALVAKELDYIPLFVGAFREPHLDTNDSWEELDLIRVGKYYPMLNGAGLSTYIKGVFFYNLGSYKILKKEQPEVIHFSDLESFPAVLFYRMFHRTNTIYNIHDNFSQRYAIPKLLKLLLNFVEGLVVNFSSRSLVPEQFRADALPKFCQDNITVIKNTPVDPGSSRITLTKADKVKIVYAGWLDEGRGLTTLLDLTAVNEIFEIHIAGEGSSEIVEKVKTHERVVYHGFLSHHDVLELTKSCHFVFAHYDPSREINIFAAPNKFAESLAIGRPVILNVETEISKLASENNVGIITRYGDVASLYRSISELIDAPEGYERMCKSARRLFDSHYGWDVVKEATKNVIVKLKG